MGVRLTEESRLKFFIDTTCLVLSEYALNYSRQYCSHFERFHFSWDLLIASVSRLNIVGLKHVINISQIFFFCLLKHASSTSKRAWVVGKGLEQYLTINLPLEIIQQLAEKVNNLPNSRGTWWIGGYENRPSEAATAGAVQGDGPQGTLASPFFKIVGKRISFLIGGGCDIKKVRAELIVDHQVRQPDRLAFSF